MALGKPRGACPPGLFEVLGWAGGLGAITAESLALHLDLGVASVRARLLWAQRLGLMARSRPLTGQPSLYSVTRRGLRVLDRPGLEPMRVGPSGARHAIECCWAAAALELSYPPLQVIGEPELRLMEREHGRPLFSVPLGPARAGNPRRHRPDLLLGVSSAHGGLPVAVEVELTIKAPRRLREICSAWTRSPNVAGVIYLTSSEVRSPLRRALATADGKVHVVQLELASLERRVMRRSSIERTITSRP